MRNNINRLTTHNSRWSIYKSDKDGQSPSFIIEVICQPASYEAVLEIVKDTMLKRQGCCTALFLIACMPKAGTLADNSNQYFTGNILHLPACSFLALPTMFHKKKISLKDIAQQAGVSAALVSYVLNGKDKKNRIRKEKAAEILQIAKELNYQPNHLAKSLRSGKSFTIGLVIADISNPFFANIARIVENQARHYGYTVIYGSSDEDATKSLDLINVLVNRRVDGLIIVSTENSEKQVHQLREQNILFVLLDRYFPELKTDFVSTNNYKAAFEAGNHLVKMGYKNIGLIAYKSKMFHMRERIRGYQEALEANKHPVKKKWMQLVRFSHAKPEVETAIDTMLLGRTPVDAIIFATYSLAVNGLKYINRLGLKVPDNLGIVSFGQAEVFDLYACPITYVKQDMENLGKIAVDVLIKKMDNPKEKNQEILLDAVLVTRESSKAKKRPVDVTEV